MEFMQIGQTWPLSRDRTQVDWQTRAPSISHDLKCLLAFTPSRLEGFELEC